MNDFSDSLSYEFKLSEIQVSKTLRTRLLWQLWVTGIHQVARGEKTQRKKNKNVKFEDASDFQDGCMTAAIGHFVPFTSNVARRTPKFFLFILDSSV